MSGEWWEKVPLSLVVDNVMTAKKPFSRSAAFCSLLLDLRKGNAVSLSGYRALWKWGANTVSSFLDEFGFEIIRTKKSKRGLLSRKNEETRGMKKDKSKEDHDPPAETEVESAGVTEAESDQEIITAELVISDPKEMEIIEEYIKQEIERKKPDNPTAYGNKIRDSIAASGGDLAKHLASKNNNNTGVFYQDEFDCLVRWEEEAPPGRQWIRKIIKEEVGVLITDSGKKNRPWRSQIVGWVTVLENDLIKGGVAVSEVEDARRIRLGIRSTRASCTDWPRHQEVLAQISHRKGQKKMDDLRTSSEIDQNKNAAAEAAKYVQQLIESKN